MNPIPVDFVPWSLKTLFPFLSLQEFYLEEPGEIVKWITNDIPELKTDKELVNAHFDGFDRRK